jgi:hypothetical protein
MGQGVVRIVVLALIGVAAWFLGRMWDGRPAPLPADAPTIQFSAARADATLGRILGPEIPHPVSSAENANVRARIQKEFAALGIATSVYEGIGCNGRPQYGYLACATTKDIIAEVLPGKGKAIVMLAHYDSVPAGPGAADDESGVATVLETTRALKARGFKSDHPIIALITDGEEAGLLGAASFLDNPALRARVGAVVNVEARGNSGPSLLFQTSAGDAPLIDLYAKSVPEYATSSLFSVIYKALPNDTDLTLFINDKLPSFNFAFSGNVAHYHTALDRRENLDPRTLQHHGDNLLGMVSALETTDFATLSGGHDDIYLTIYGKLLPRMPVGWALPLAVLAFTLLLLTAFLSRAGTTLGGWLRAFSILPVMLLGSAALGWVLHTIASLVSGQPDPSYAYPTVLRLALAAGVLLVFVLCTRFAETKLAALALWLWMGFLALVCALFLPGLSPYFLFPAVIAAVLLPVQSRLQGAWTGAAGQIALALAGALPVVIWMSLTQAGESVQGLAIHPLFTIPAAFGMAALLPLAAGSLAGGMWRVSLAVCAVIAVALAVVQGTEPAYSAIAPQRLSIAFLDDHSTNKASWIANTAAKLPASLRAVAKFSDAPQPPLIPIQRQPTYSADAGKARFAPPFIVVSFLKSGSSGEVYLDIRGSEETAQMLVVIPEAIGLKAVTVNGKRTAASNWADKAFIGCMSSDCRAEKVTIEAGSKPFDFYVAEIRFGLPPDGQKLVAARPKESVRSQNGDNTIVLRKVHVP